MTSGRCSRSCSRIIGNEEGGDQTDGSEESNAQFVIACGDAAKLFEFIEEAFDAVALTVALLVVGRFLAARADRWNHRFDAVGGQTLPNTIRIVALVEGRRLQNIVWIEAVIETFKLPTIMGLARCQMQRDPAVFIDRGRVDFGGKSPARASQSLVGALFFGAPAACG